MFHRPDASAPRRRPQKPRFRAVFALLLALSVLMGPMVHAMETASWTSASVVAALDPDHFDGDGDQVPSDLEKGYAHHHAHCHGHQIGEPAGNGSPVGYVFARRITLPFEASDEIASAPVDPALRPPIA